MAVLYPNQCDKGELHRDCTAHTVNPEIFARILFL